MCLNGPRRLLFVIKDVASVRFAAVSKEVCGWTCGQVRSLRLRQLTLSRPGFTRKQSLPLVPRTALSHHLSHILNHDGQQQGLQDALRGRAADNACVGELRRPSRVFSISIDGVFCEASAVPAGGQSGPFASSSASRPSPYISVASS